MTLLQLLIYATLTSGAKTDSERMQHVIDWKYRDQPSLTLATAEQYSAPLDIYENATPLEFAQNSHE